MRGMILAILIAAIVLAFCLAAVASADDGLPGIGPGLTQIASMPAGSSAFFPAVTVQAIHSHGSAWTGGVPWWAARDTESPSVLAVIGLPSELRVGQVCDIAGTIEWGGTRPYLTNTQIWAYLSPDTGSILYGNNAGDFSLFRPLMTQLWEPRVQLDVPSVVTGQSFRAMDIEGPPDSGGEAGFVPIYCDTIDDATGLCDSTADQPIYVELDGRGLQGIDSGSFLVLEDTSTDQIEAVYSSSSQLSNTDRIQCMAGAISQDSSGAYVINVDSVVQDQAQGYVLTVPSACTLGQARTQTVLGTEVNVASLQVYGVSCSGSDYTLYCEMPGRASGCRVVSPQSAAVGSGIEVVGITAVDSAGTGEWYIDVIDDPNGSVTSDSTGLSPVVRPVGLPLKSMGGNFNHLAGQNFSPGALNVGLLVRCWGHVTYIDSSATPQYFLLDDGSGSSSVGNSSGSGCSGIKVSLVWGSTVIAPPQAGSVVAVVGESSAEIVEGNWYRVLRPSSAGFTQYMAPSVAVDISSPPGGALHKDPLASSITISGTASGYPRVNDVEVAIDSTGGTQAPSEGWAEASFTRGASPAWTANRTGVTAGNTYTIWARATNSWGAAAATYETVTVSNAATVFYVDSSGNDNNTGTSWSQAIPDCRGGHQLCRRHQFRRRGLGSGGSLPGVRHRGDRRGPLRWVQRSRHGNDPRAARLGREQDDC